MYIKKDFAIIESNRSFEERVKEWREFLKIDRAEAAKYYNENVFPEVIKKCAENTAKNENTAEILKPDYMILTVGTSREPLILSISTIQPQKEILFLYTAETRTVMAEVISFLELSAEHYTAEEVERSSTVKIDRIVKEQYGKWKRNHENNPNGRVIIDFTGGTKAMSGGGAMSALLIDAELVYIDSIYDNVLRMPCPGSEYVNLIKNPYEISGAIEYEKAVKLFEENDYKGSEKILKNILKYVRGDEYYKYNLLKQLSYTYSAWEEIDFERAFDNMEHLIANIEALSKNESPVTFFRNKIKFLTAQKDLLYSLHNTQKDLLNNRASVYDALKQHDNKGIMNLIFFLILQL